MRLLVTIWTQNNEVARRVTFQQVTGEVQRVQLERGFRFAAFGTVILRLLAKRFFQPAHLGVVKGIEADVKNQTRQY